VIRCLPRICFATFEGRGAVVAVSAVVVTDVVVIAVAGVVIAVAGVVIVVVVVTAAAVAVVVVVVVIVIVIAVVIVVAAVVVVVALVVVVAVVVTAVVSAVVSFDDRRRNQVYLCTIFPDKQNKCGICMYDKSWPTHVNTNTKYLFSKFQLFCAGSEFFEQICISNCSIFYCWTTQC
jgi:hypothetical protein